MSLLLFCLVWVFPCVNIHTRSQPTVYMCIPGLSLLQICCYLMADNLTRNGSTNYAKNAKMLKTVTPFHSLSTREHWQSLQPTHALSIVYPAKWLYKVLCNHCFFYNYISIVTLIKNRHCWASMWLSWRRHRSPRNHNITHWPSHNRSLFILCVNYQIKGKMSINNLKANRLSCFAEANKDTEE